MTVMSFGEAVGYSICSPGIWYIRVSDSAGLSTTLSMECNSTANGDDGLPDAPGPAMDSDDDASKDDDAGASHGGFGWEYLYYIAVIVISALGLGVIRWI